MANVLGKYKFKAMFFKLWLFDNNTYLKLIQSAGL